jgi:glycosyltransferase involved in cell wall biosynthesis
MPVKRVAFDARYINDRYHGIGRYAFSLLNALVKVSPEITYVIFRGREQDSRFNWNEITNKPNIEVRQGPWPLYLPFEQLKWPGYLRESRVDLFHSPYIIAPLLSNIPSLITVHDLIFDRYPEYMPSAWSRPYYRAMMKLDTRHSRKVICVSDFTANDLVRFYKTPREKITVIPEGVDGSFKRQLSNAGADALCQRYQLNMPFILSIGARRPHKNLSALVQAFAPLRNELSHSLVFVSPQDKRFPDEAMQQATHLGLDGRARFLDWVPESDLPGLYNLADMVVLPSLIEGFGLPALEAMASGTPVIAADSSSFPEVVGESGLLVDMNDISGVQMAIRNIANDRKLRTRFSQAGIQRAQLFTWERTASAILELYRSI